MQNKNTLDLADSTEIVYLSRRKGIWKKYGLILTNQEYPTV